MNDVNSKINSGLLSYKDLAACDKLLAKLKVKILRFKEKYDLIMEIEAQQNKPVIHISKHAFNPGIDYIWVVFKNNETPKIVYKLHEKEHPVALMCKTLLCIQDEQADNSSFE